MAKQEPGYLPFKVKALFNYTAQSTSGNPQINLVTGGVYDVTRTDGQGHWWFGKDNAGREGWFPAGYTEVLPQQQNLPNQNSQPPNQNQFSQPQNQYQNQVPQGQNYSMNNQNSQYMPQNQQPQNHNYSPNMNNQIQPQSQNPYGQNQQQQQQVPQGS
jgi:hypothetical protein